MKNTLGMIIKTARINAGLSVRDLADLCNLTYKHIEKIEKDKVKEPHLSTLKKLANALDLDFKILNYSYKSSANVSVKNLGNIVYTARINAGYSQSKLADLCNLSSVQIINIEQNRTKRPHLFTLEQLASVLDLDLQELKQICRYS